jgi:peptidoglycan-associated lipoprotein
MKKVDNKPIQLKSLVVSQENYKLQKITLFFDSDKYNLDKKSIKKLELFINSLKKREHMTIKIMGNTDRFGSQEYNYYKGLKRAKFTEKFFIGKGLKKENIISLSFGESNPMCVEETKECYAKNRRVDILEIY